MDQSSTQVSLDDFAYDLPEELIAQEPPAIRHGSRLLFVDRAADRFEDRMFTDLPELLAAGDLLIVNDTKVIPARLLAQRQTGAQVEILLLRPQAAQPGIWTAMAAPLRKLKQGESLIVLNSDGFQVRVAGFVTADGGQKRVLLDFGGNENVFKTLSGAGLAPLPPYINRQAANGRASDLERYQTVFAQAPGAVAAPTAGLHFSDEIFQRLEARGVQVGKVTLHVGPGTFKPITTSLEEHSIETESFHVSPQTAALINQAKKEKRRIIAVGTTSCRTLETAGSSGLMQSVEDGNTGLYIKPGFQFQIIDGVVTNFHLSRSSLLVLVSAFGGCGLIRRAYEHAVQQRYRFFSYGDAMLII